MLGQYNNADGHTDGTVVVIADDFDTDCTCVINDAAGIVVAVCVVSYSRSVGQQKKQHRLGIHMVCAEIEQ